MDKAPPGSDLSPFYRLHTSHSPPQQTIAHTRKLRPLRTTLGFVLTGAVLAAGLMGRFRYPPRSGTATAHSWSTAQCSRSAVPPNGTAVPGGLTGTIKSKTKKPLTSGLPHRWRPPGVGADGDRHPPRRRSRATPAPSSGAVLITGGTLAFGFFPLPHQLYRTFSLSRDAKNLSHGGR